MLKLKVLNLQNSHDEFNWEFGKSSTGEEDEVEKVAFLSLVQ